MVPLDYHKPPTPLHYYTTAVQYYDSAALSVSSATLILHASFLLAVVNQTSSFIPTFLLFKLFSLQGEKLDTPNIYREMF